MVFPLLGVLATAARIVVPFVAKKIIPAVTKTFFGTFTRTALTTGGVGLLVGLPKERRVSVAKGIITAPFRGGEAIGETIGEAPETGIIGTLGTAGLVGLGAVGAVVVGKKIIEKVSVKKAVVQELAISPLVATSAIPTVIDKPLTTGPAPPKKPAELLKPPVAMPSIRITNKPRINVDITFRKSRRFINQQVLVRS